MRCPEHKTELWKKRTQYGPRYECTTPGCTVACWGGDTSTPADAETRAARHRAHQSFDPLWQKKSKAKRFKNRGAAYNWMRLALRLQKSEAHIGMFNKEQCARLIEHVSTLLENSNVQETVRNDRDDHASDRQSVDREDPPQKPQVA